MAAMLCSFMVVAAPAPASAMGENTILALVNQDRVANGLGPLALNGAMSAVSLAWANQMAASGAMTHNPDYPSQIPGGWSNAGENVAQGYSSPGEVHNAWMNSAGHRANILGDFSDIGIAFISVGGTTWAVENFAKYGASASAPAPPAPPAPAPAPPAPPAPPPASPQPATGTPTAPGLPSASSGPVPTPSTSPRATTSDSPEHASDSDGPRGSSETPKEIAALGNDHGPSLVARLGILLGFLVAVIGAWTGMLLRRRWQK